MGVQQYMKEPESLLHGVYLWGKAETKQIVCHKENIFIKTAHWVFVQTIFSFSEFRQGLDAKKTLAYTIPPK